MQRVLSSLIDTLPVLKTSLQDNSERLRESVDVIQNLAKNVIDKVLKPIQHNTNCTRETNVHLLFQLTELELTASSKEDLDAKMTAIDGQLHILRKALTFVCKHTACKHTYT